MILRRTSTFGFATNVSSKSFRFRSQRPANAFSASLVSSTESKHKNSAEYDTGICAQYNAFTAPALRKSVPDSITSSRYSFTRFRPNTPVQGHIKSLLKLGLVSSIPASSNGMKNTPDNGSALFMTCATNHFRRSSFKALTSQRISSSAGFCACSAAIAGGGCALDSAAPCWYPAEKSSHKLSQFMDSNISGFFQVKNDSSICHFWSGNDAHLHPH